MYKNFGFHRGKMNDDIDLDKDYWVGPGFCFPADNIGSHVIDFFLKITGWMVLVCNVDQSDADGAANYIYYYDNDPLGAKDMVEYYLVQAGIFDAEVWLIWE